MSMSISYYFLIISPLCRQYENSFLVNRVRHFIRPSNKLIWYGLSQSTNALRYHKANVPWKGHSVLTAHFIISEKYFLTMYFVLSCTLFLPMLIPNILFDFMTWILPLYHIHIDGYFLSSFSFSHHWPTVVSDVNNTRCKNKRCCRKLIWNVRTTTYIFVFIQEELLCSISQ